MFNRETHGKTGCWTGSGFQSQSGGAPQLRDISEITAPETKRRISYLSGEISRRKSLIEAASSDSRGHFQKYLNTKIEPCGGGWSAVGTAFVGPSWSGLDGCLKRQQQQYASTMDKGLGAFSRIRIERAELYANFAELMSFSPNVDAWNALCLKKLEVDRTYSDLTKKLTDDFIVKAREKLKGELAAQEAAQTAFNQLEAFFRNFLQALKNLISAIADIFAVFLTGAALAVRFVAENKWALYAVFAALLVGGGRYVMKKLR